jgi:hypothetical protein
MVRQTVPGTDAMIFRRCLSTWKSLVRGFLFLLALLFTAAKYLVLSCYDQLAFHCIAGAGRFTPPASG